MIQYALNRQLSTSHVSGNRVQTTAADVLLLGPDLQRILRFILRLSILRLS